jgi:signal transduction histidine kinase
MFKSAIFRLTGWYLLILMLLSLVFSMIAYQVASDEVQNHFNSFQSSLQQAAPDDDSVEPLIVTTRNFRKTEVSDTRYNLIVNLIKINILVLLLGGLGSYLLARHNLEPIKKAYEAQSRFTSDASHELRTPLTVMKTETEVILRNKTATTEDLRQTLLSNLEEIDNLSKLAEMLLNLSKLDSTNSLKYHPVNLNKLTRSVINDFNQPSSRIKLISDQPQVVYGNEMALKDLIKILVDNALQYSPAESLITINITRQDQSAKFVITNLGHGIEPNKLPHIFDRFYRADSSRTDTGHKSYGLGLSLAKRIVELHDGQLSASSIVNDKTSFCFVINLNSAPKAKIQD